MGNFPSLNCPEPCGNCDTVADDARRIYSLPLQAVVCERCERDLIVWLPTDDDFGPIGAQLMRFCPEETP